jgi:hypothetical protein
VRCSPPQSARSSVVTNSDTALHGVYALCDVFEADWTTLKLPVHPRQITISATCSSLGADPRRPTQHVAATITKKQLPNFVVNPTLDRGTSNRVDSKLEQVLTSQALRAILKQEMEGTIPKRWQRRCIYAAAFVVDPTGPLAPSTALGVTCNNGFALHGSPNPRHHRHGSSWSSAPNRCTIFILVAEIGQAAWRC